MSDNAGDKPTNPPRIDTDALTEATTIEDIIAATEIPPTTHHVRNVIQSTTEHPNTKDDDT